MTEQVWGAVSLFVIAVVLFHIFAYPRLFSIVRHRRYQEEGLWKDEHATNMDKKTRSLTTLRTAREKEVDDEDEGTWGTLRQDACKDDGTWVCTRSSAHEDEGTLENSWKWVKFEDLVYEDEGTWIIVRNLSYKDEGTYTKVRRVCFKDEGLWRMLRHAVFGIIYMKGIRLLWYYPFSRVWFWKSPLFYSQLSSLGEWDLMEGIIFFLVTTVIYRCVTGVLSQIGQAEISYNPNSDVDTFGMNYLFSGLLGVLNVLDLFFLHKCTDSELLKMLSTHIIAASFGFWFSFMLHIRGPQNKGYKALIARYIKCHWLVTPILDFVEVLAIPLLLIFVELAVSDERSGEAQDLPRYNSHTDFIDSRIRYRHIIAVCYIFQPWKSSFNERDSVYCGCLTSIQL